MFISTNWIKDYVNLDGLDLEKLIHQFTLSTAEVEDIYYKGRDVSNVVVGEIVSFEKHPDSKKLHLLKVDTGEGIVDCVCGAPNAELGIKVAFAKAGGRVPEGEIKACKVAGYDSFGMCCSGKELGISDDHSGILVLDNDIPNGTDIKEVFPIDDVIFEVDNKSLTNRPDLWGHYGIAREIAAITKRELKPIELKNPEYNGDNEISVEIEREDLVYRYSCIKMDNITKNTAPYEMQVRLYYCGMRSINLLADLTNYLMLELGQPTHAFNASKIDTINVKTFDKTFTFKTLDGEEREITPETLMITNDGTPVGIAGIMGGLDSEIVEETSGVVLECASFDGISIRKSSARMGLRTDASMRYEKMLDPELTMIALKRFVKLLSDIDPKVKVASKVTDKYVKHYPEVELSFDKKYVDRYTGIDIKDEEIVETLTRLGFLLTKNGENFVVKVPSWRATKDVTIKADIIEEITRIYGYDNFEIKTTLSALKPVKLSNGKAGDNLIKDILVKFGKLHEVHSYVWCDEKKYKKLGIEVEDNVKILNIESSGNGVLRNSMIPTLLSFAYENKTYSPEYGIFEIGRVIEGTDKDNNCIEKKKLCVLLMSRNKTEKEVYFEAVDLILKIFSDMKHSKPEFTKVQPKHKYQHPRNTSDIAFNGTSVGLISTFHPAVLAKFDKKTCAVVTFEIDLDLFEEMKGEKIEFEEVSRFPGIDFDLSLNVGQGMRFSDIEKAWKGLEIESLKDVKVIDIYENEILRSVTLRFSFSSMERSLTGDEVQENMNKIMDNLKGMGIILRA